MPLPLEVCFGWQLDLLVLLDEAFKAIVNPRQLFPENPVFSSARQRGLVELDGEELTAIAESFKLVAIARSDRMTHGFLVEPLEDQGVAVAAPVPWPPHRQSFHERILGQPMWRCQAESISSSWRATRTTASCGKQASST